WDCRWAGQACSTPSARWSGSRCAAGTPPRGRRRSGNPRSRPSAPGRTAGSPAGSRSRWRSPTEREGGGMSLAEFWFVVIGYLFAGYFLLEGFDFGVGVLLSVLGLYDTGRRVLINTIGPVWDANETWVVVAGASMFAAFPYWYASVFSGFYVPLLVILLALIVRGVAFEYRGKVDDARWRRRWDAAIV